MLLLLILPLYIGIFIVFYRFKRVIKMISDIESLMSDEIPVDKRDFLIERVKNGEFISNSKTPWTVERLEKASDKVVDKLFGKYRKSLA